MHFQVSMSQSLLSIRQVNAATGSAASVVGSFSSSRASRRKWFNQPKVRSTTQRRGNSTKPESDQICESLINFPNAVPESG